jgi:hypothetical protein
MLRKTEGSVNEVDRRKRATMIIKQIEKEISELEQS